MSIWMIIAIVLSFLFVLAIVGIVVVGIVLSRSKGENGKGGGGDEGKEGTDGADEVTRAKLKDELSQLSELVCNSHNELSQLNELIYNSHNELAERQRQLAELDSSIVSKAMEFQEAVKEVQDVKNDKVALETTIETLSATKQEEERKIGIMRRELSDMQLTLRVAKSKVAPNGEEEEESEETGRWALVLNMNVDNNKLGTSALTMRELEIVDGIDKIKAELRKVLSAEGGVAPAIEEQLNKVVWSKIWMPKFQEFFKKRPDGWGDGGIYCIRVIKDGRCYIGQASGSIKDRWYAHAKKMCGAMPCGGEKIYAVAKEEGLRVCDFEWEILEEGGRKGREGREESGGGGGWSLDERERYWIDAMGDLNIK